MPLIRDDDEERRTRIEHMLEQLQRQHDGIDEASEGRIRLTTAREALRAVTRTSRAARLERERERERTRTSYRNKR